MALRLSGYWPEQHYLWLYRLGRADLVTRQTDCACLFASLSSASRSIWAKSGEPQGHGLLCHMLDIAAVAEVLLEHCNIDDHHLSVMFFLPASSVRLWLAAMVGLHDFGKAIPGFQSKWEAGRLLDQQAGLLFEGKCLDKDRHDLATAALVPEFIKSRAAPPQWVRGVVQAISAHHGFNFTGLQVKEAKPLREPKIWQQARQDIFDAYWQTLSPPDVPEDQELSLIAVEWLAGLTSVCDWIGSNVDWFPCGERHATLSGHYEQAMRLACSALADPAKLGWPEFQALLKQPQLNCDELVTRILGSASPVSARPLQKIADDLLAKSAGPALLVVEAPMGEGKTELAFLASLRLQARQQHRGLYLALPTQATGNALFERALTFLRAFANGQPLDIQLAHGGAAMNETVACLRDIWGDAGNDAIRSSAWFAQRRRALLSPYGVGTVDQALFGVMNVKHHFVRLWGLANKVVVLDEVHAYDTYTSSLIETLLRWLKGMGCSVILMSATLPQQKRAALLQAWGAAEAIPDVPYPRVLLADAHGINGDTFSAREQQPVLVGGVDESLESIAAQALASLQQGGCGAVIVNTVDRAQQLYRLLVGQLGPDVALLLFHARFPADERRQIEQQVLQTFGAPGASASRPAKALLIATQVAEQSLDIDFDFLISDLAPVDLLLQRAGRLHRHRREHRPVAHLQPRLLVAGLLPDRLPDLEKTNWGRIYGDYLCLVTWAILLHEPVWRLPQDIDRLVQAVYAPWPVLPNLAEEIIQKIEDVSRTEHKAQADFLAQLARHVAIDPRVAPAYAYADKPHGADDDDTLGLRNVTRQGDESIAVTPIWQASDEEWRISPEGAPFDPQHPASDALARQLYSRQLKLSRKAIVKHLIGQKTWPVLAEHPLLANIHPLLLQNGCCRIGKLVIRLDPKLGLVYESESLQETR